MEALTDLGAIGEFVGGQVNFSEGALSDQTAELVATNGLEVLAGELTVNKN